MDFSHASFDLILLRLTFGTGAVRTPAAGARLERGSNFKRTASNSGQSVEPADADGVQSAGAKVGLFWRRWNELAAVTGLNE